MYDVITIGEAMIAFDPLKTGPMKFVHTFERKIGGAELNTAIGCARLGLRTGWISSLGNDEFGKYIRDFARGEGIDVSQVKLVDGYPTSLNFKEIFEDGNVRTYYYRDKSPTLTMTPLDLKESYFKKAKILHLTGIFPAINQKNNMRIIEKAIELAKANNVLISFDPNIRLKMWSKSEAKETLLNILPNVDILLAGDDEMEIILGTKVPEQIFHQLREFNMSFIAIKRGEKGSVGFNESKTMELPAIKNTSVVDTVGAGDGFNAGVLYGYLQKWSLKKILTFANMIGSIVVGVKGDNDGLPYLEEVNARLGGKEIIDR